MGYGSAASVYQPCRAQAVRYNQRVIHERFPGDAALAADIQKYIAAEDSGSFEGLLLRLFARQYALNEPYKTYCDSLSETPKTVRLWQDIPAVPARAFKIATLSCAPLLEVTHTFHSSGTTEGQPGRHFMDDTAARLYRTALTAGFRRIVPSGLPIIALMPSAADAPNSSLSFMLDALCPEGFYWGDTAGLAKRLDHAVSEARPVCVFGTAFALLELFDETAVRWRLPLGSIVIETGGFKGRTRQVTRQELYELVDERLGLRPPQAFAEYGMSEMSSQFYGAPGQGLIGGHWLRARIIDPITNTDTATGGEGLLRHYDLANWNSVAVIQTQDIARRLTDGGFELLGRSPGADLRGCSLTVEERWTSAALGR